MNKRDETKKGILFEVFDQPVTTIDALVERCHRALSAEIWITCCWPEAATGWKVGDFNYLVVAVTPDSATNLSVRFWSEPQEPVLNEVCSGAWCPGAIRYIGPTERSALEARGYIVSGRAHNYSRRLVIDSAAKAEAAALETLQVMFDIFGYRGQWPLQIERHRGER